MSARDEIFDRLTGACIPADRAKAMLDAHRAEVLGDAADRIERRARQLQGEWLRADQVVATLRHLGTEEATS